MNYEPSFSMPLRTGLLSGTGILPIGNNGLRGIEIQLRLTPDATVFNGFLDEAGVVKNNASGCFYQLRDLSLSFDF